MMPKKHQLKRNVRLSMGLTVVVMLLSTVSACSSVGSESWCNNLKETPKGDWSANEAKDYAKHCLFK
jgi:hypothetical protein